MTQYNKDATSEHQATNHEMHGIRVEEVDHRADIDVCEHWRLMWSEAGMPQEEFVEDFNDRTIDFIENAREKLEYKTFAAYNQQNELVASVSCQVWNGTMPNACVSSEFKVGTMWAVYVKPEFRRKGIATELVRHCISHWRSIGCKAAVLIYASDGGRRIYERQGFAKDNLLLLDLPTSKSSTATTQGDWTITHADQKADALLVSNWRKVWLENGKPAESLRQDVGPSTMDFITNARETLDFQAFVARDSKGRVVGSAACQAWAGPLPLVIRERAFKLGSIWGLYVSPEHRGKGIGKQLLLCCNEHLAAIGCKRSITLATSKGSADWLRHCGFAPSNAMTLDLGEAPAVAREHDPLPSNVTVQAAEELGGSHETLAAATIQHRGWLLRANANQLRAVALGPDVEGAVVATQKRHGLWMDPQDNWFTQNVKRFGKGFDMERLGKDKALLAAKFDRLSPNYEAWTLGNRSVVEDWVASTLRQAHGEGGLGPSSHVVDVACGVGLMGQTLRLLGFRGMLSGVDVSRGMVEEARGRRCYDVLWAEDVREGIAAESGSADVVLCTGAMELLSAPLALVEFHRMLAPGGELWVTFQLASEAGTEGATAHQHVVGMRRAEIEQLLAASGYAVTSTEEVPAAFCTPSPAQDGSLVPVPYLFARCRLVAS